ncbi:hypothetical protein L218DRAFT_953120 [Marasmius fiardii PR-910]|nr:hypothetical protein L218DRAFT_953120 [Marasmius fiardii PR-910]
MSTGHQWTTGPRLPNQQSSPNSTPSDTSSYKYDTLQVPYSMAFSDDGEEVTDLIETHGERVIRRRSSKACDQCRKSKCKCERTSPSEPCRNCVMLGTECTSLGPSRKRGPPKGYIDAIEARLHQMEALLGIMLSCDDDRATTLLKDLSQDPLVNEIIDRVDKSSYGVKGRVRHNERSGNGSKGRYVQTKQNDDNSELASTHPSNEWQDAVVDMLHSKCKAKDNRLDTPRNPIFEVSDNSLADQPQSRRPALSLDTDRRPSTANTDDSGGSSPARRQRRRINDDTLDGTDIDRARKSASTPSTSTSRSVNSPLGRATSSQSSRVSQSPQSFEFNVPNPPPSAATKSTQSRNRIHTTRPSLIDVEGYLSEDEDVPNAIGQLSLNEEEQVRYHGKTSGLHLLGAEDRIDDTSMGGIWRFPKARIWPPVSESSSGTSFEVDTVSRYPPLEVQEKLLDLYFTHVHPIFPVIHKETFFDHFRALHSDGSRIPSPQEASTVLGSQPAASSPPNSRRRSVPPVLLFAIFAVAARYSKSPSRPEPSHNSSIAEAMPIWDAGDEYLEQARRILERSYTCSRPETCQALLLMGYREIGIGAMTEAWMYVGLAIRMAQDLGMHRRADGWARAGLGGRLFGDWELQERRRIWFACVIMDKYVSSSIGRPLMIFERDFDTLLPDEDDPEEREPWNRHRLVYEDEDSGSDGVPEVPGRIISCFNAAAILSGILSMIIQTVYAARPACDRHGESAFLEGILDKWFHDLPDHLRQEPSSKNVPLPHVLTLHMQYWSAVLLLHRPFIRMHQTKNRGGVEASDESDLRTVSRRHHELSTGAANRITSLAALYMDHYSSKFCPPFLCYYIFSAGIMHLTTISTFPHDPQARIGLNKCMDILYAMEIVWPSASCALELLKGSKINWTQGCPTPPSADSLDRRKRPYVKISETEPQPLYPDYPPSETYSRNNHHTQNYHHPSAPAPLPSSGSSTIATYYHETEHRWAPNNHFDNVHYVGSLTTSALPQSYSTGLTDDCPMVDEPRSGQHSSMSQHSHSPGGPRYSPEYWNDYSAYPQITDNSYNHVHQSQHSAVQHHSTSSQMFLHQPYSNYSDSV